MVNAVEHSGEGGGVVTLLRVGDTMTLRVEDSGVGIHHNMAAASEEISVARAFQPGPEGTSSGSGIQGRRSGACCFGHDADSRSDALPAVGGDQLCGRERRRIRERWERRLSSRSPGRADSRYLRSRSPSIPTRSARLARAGQGVSTQRRRACHNFYIQSPSFDEQMSTQGGTDGKRREANVDPQGDRVPQTVVRSPRPPGPSGHQSRPLQGHCRTFWLAGAEALEIRDRLASSGDLDRFKTEMNAWAASNDVGFKGPIGAMFINSLVNNTDDRASLTTTRQWLDRAYESRVGCPENRRSGRPRKPHPGRRASCPGIRSLRAFLLLGARATPRMAYLLAE